ncbi:MAG: beta-lactamase family protein [Bacteroidetes bacterium]|nr:beta-lactamase family protein [Bacteroidota bacterium]
MQISFVAVMLTVSILASRTLAQAQPSTKDRQIRITKEFIAAYNHQNFDRMNDVFLRRTDLSDEERTTIRQGIVSQFSALYKEYGKATVTSVDAETLNTIVLKLVYRKDPRENMSLIFVFDDSCIVQGFGFTDPDFVFPVATRTKPDRKVARRQVRELDKLLATIVTDQHFNGAVLAIDRGTTIYKKCFGRTNVTEETSLNDSSLFELASCSKQFTAMAIMILAEQGKLNYTDSLQRFIPELPYRNITIENLLTHTSGLPDYMELFAEHWDRRRFATNADVIELLKTHSPPLLFQPGAKFRYSNTGYALLSSIIERASGSDYATCLHELIFKPCGMRNSRVYNTRRSKGETLRNYAFGYTYSDSLEKYVLPDSTSEHGYVTYLDAITGDGCVNSTIDDLERWEAALQNNVLVSRETLSRAYTSSILTSGKESRYGYGVFLQNRPHAEFTVYHSGSWPGYKTFILRFPRLRSALAILSNNDYPNVVWLGNRIARILAEEHAYKR